MTGYNPYQPPADDPVGHPMSQPPTAGEALPWDVGPAISAGWRATKAYWPVLVFAPIVVQIINQALSFGVTTAGTFMGPELLAVVNAVAGFVVGAFFAVGTTRIFLTAARGESPDFGVLFSGADRFLDLLLTQFLMFLVIMIGFVLLIIPGIILSLGLFFAPYVCVDQGLGPVESLKKSWEITMGHKSSIFVYGLAAALVLLAGLLALIVGVFVSVAVVTAGYAFIYLRLTGQPSTYEPTDY